MPDINFQDILNQMKDGLITLAGTSLHQFLSDAESDAKTLLNTLKDDLKKWTTELANGDISISDFEFLLEAKKDLIEMAALKQAGLSEIQLDKFKSDAFNLIVNVIKGVI